MVDQNNKLYKVLKSSLLVVYLLSLIYSLTMISLAIIELSSPSENCDQDNKINHQSWLNKIKHDHILWIFQNRWEFNHFLNNRSLFNDMLCDRIRSCNSGKPLHNVNSVHVQLYWVAWWCRIGLLVDINIDINSQITYNNFYHVNH